MKKIKDYIYHLKNLCMKENKRFRSRISINSSPVIIEQDQGNVTQNKFVNRKIFDQLSDKHKNWMHLDIKDSDQRQFLLNCLNAKQKTQNLR